MSIFNSANNLDLAESSDYEKYINLLNSIKKKCKKYKTSNILFVWETNFKKLIKNDNDLDNIVKNNELIKKLFEGYPEFVIKNHSSKYKSK